MVSMYSFEDLAQHLKDKHGLAMDQNQIQSLRNIGYYHGYKGYRFIRKSTNRIEFENFSQVVALNNFDMELKSLFYPLLMNLETALKNRVLEATLLECQTESLSIIYQKGLTRYKECSTSSDSYRKEFKRRMDLEIQITKALTRDYMAGKAVATHFYNSDRDIPIWAAFESLTLGEFGSFFACCNKNIRMAVSKQLCLPTNLDSDGLLLKEIIFCLKDLRNAIAHNGIVFDTRFTTAKINKTIPKLLEDALQITQIDFNYIVAYLALLCYMMKAIGEKPKGITNKINEYKKFSDMLKRLPKNTSMKILGSQDKKITDALTNFINQT